MKLSGVDIDLLPFSSPCSMEVLVCGFQLGTLRRMKCLLGKKGETISKERWWKIFKERAEP